MPKLSSLKMDSIAREKKKRMKIFDSLPEDIRIKLEKHLKLFVYQKKQIVHRSGFIPIGLFIIRKGKVKIYRISDSSKEIIIHIAGEGDQN